MIEWIRDVTSDLWGEFSEGVRMGLGVLGMLLTIGCGLIVAAILLAVALHLLGIHPPK